MSIDPSKLIVGPRPNRANERLGESIRRVQSRLVDAGQAAAVAACSVEELVAQLKQADAEIASFDALRDQDALLDILRLETQPSPMLDELFAARRRTEEAIAAQDFELAATLRARHRLLAARLRERSFVDEDCLTRLRLAGLVVRVDDHQPPRLTDAGRRLAVSLL